VEEGLPAPTDDILLGQPALRPPVFKDLEELELWLLQKYNLKIDINLGTENSCVVKTFKSKLLKCSPRSGLAKK
jgi:hypothetical protein